METRFLRTLLAVIESSSIAAAARKENLTPSAVVQRLRALEDEVGTALVRRAGHSMRPTEAGIAVVDAARRIVELTETLPGLANQNEEIGRIRVGIIHSMTTGLLPEILTSMKENRPGIHVEVQPGQSTELFQRMTEGGLDAAILVEPPFAIPKEFTWLELRRDPLVLLCNAEETRNDPVDILRTSSFIRYDRKHWGGRSAETYLRRMKINIVEKYELDSLEAIAVLVNKGLGVSLIPDWLPPWPEGLSLRKIPVDKVSSRGVGIVHARLTPNERLVKAFAEEAKAAARLKNRVAASE